MIDDPITTATVGVVTAGAAWLGTDLGLVSIAVLAATAAYWHAVAGGASDGLLDSSIDIGGVTDATEPETPHVVGESTLEDWHATVATAADHTDCPHCDEDLPAVAEEMAEVLADD